VIIASVSIVSKYHSLESTIVKASQYNHLCQVFGTTPFACSEVINISSLLYVCLLSNFFNVTYLPVSIAVDISVDKQRFLLRAFILSYSY